MFTGPASVWSDGWDVLSTCCQGFFFLSSGMGKSLYWTKALTANIQMWLMVPVPRAEFRDHRPSWEFYLGLSKRAKNLRAGKPRWPCSQIPIQRWGGLYSPAESRAPRWLHVVAKSFLMQGLYFFGTTRSKSFFLFCRFIPLLNQPVRSQLLHRPDFQHFPFLPGTWKEHKSRCLSLTLLFPNTAQLQSVSKCHQLQNFHLKSDTVTPPHPYHPGPYHHCLSPEPAKEPEISLCFHLKTCLSSFLWLPHIPRAEPTPLTTVPEALCPGSTASSHHSVLTPWVSATHDLLPFPLDSDGFLSSIQAHPSGHCLELSF